MKKKNANKKLAFRSSKLNERIKKEKFSIKEEYRKSWAYIHESKIFIYFVIGIFLFFALLGFFVPAPEFLYNTIMNYIRDILGQTSNLSPLQLIVFIISNNIQSTFLSIFLGIILGIFPIVSTLINGYVLGFVSLLSVNNGGILTLWKLFPHGIFELPAVFISLGLGMKLGMFIFKKDKLKHFRDYMTNSLRVFLLIVIPLLIIAGIIEGTLIALMK